MPGITSFHSRTVLGEAVAFAYDALNANRARTSLTALGVVVGTAALILVVTVGMTGRQYVLRLIDAIGVNWVFAEYQGAAHRISDTTPDPLTLSDLNAVLQQVPGIAAATPIVSLEEKMPVGGSQEDDVQVLGVYPDYVNIRDLVIISGRFFDTRDMFARNKVGVISEKLATRLYGSSAWSVGHEMKLSGLPFTVIGTFRERVDTFGQSEITTYTMIVPYTASRFFVEGEAVKQLYFSVRDRSLVVPTTAHIRQVIQSRHRPESTYVVSNLTRLIELADKTATGLMLVLLLIAAVTLLVSGIGIMNIMLATVSARTHEIGIRKAVGATKQAIRLQFLAEAVMISLSGGVIGVVAGLGLPLSIRFLTDYRIPISGLSAIVAIVVCALVGILFGTVPAARAAHLDPVESLRQE